MDYTKRPETYRKETTVAGYSHTRVDQAQRLHKECAPPLHVGLIVKTNLHTQAQAHGILCSSDLTLADASRVDDYGLRFQLECHVREAKQDWGLEDFMHVIPSGVTNAANRSWFMVNGGL